MNCPKCNSTQSEIHKEPGAAAFYSCVECGRFLKWVVPRVKKVKKVKDE